MVDGGSTVVLVWVLMGLVIYLLFIYSRSGVLL